MPPAGDPKARKLICLTGFMGSGKTTIGRLLSQQLGWRFLDLDSIVEERAGLTIPAIFERLGEPAFREMESEALDRCLGQARESGQGAVVALGGGTIAQPKNQELLRATPGALIWLECPVEELLARCATITNRPLFRDEASFRRLYAERLPFYERAEFHVDSTGDPRRVVERILALGILEKVNA